MSLDWQVDSGASAAGWIHRPMFQLRSGTDYQRIPRVRNEQDDGGTAVP